MVAGELGDLKHAILDQTLREIQKMLVKKILTIMIAADLLIACGHWGRKSGDTLNPASEQKNDLGLSLSSTANSQQCYWDVKPNLEKATNLLASSQTVKGPTDLTQQVTDDPNCQLLDVYYLDCETSQGCQFQFTADFNGKPLMIKIFDDSGAPLALNRGQTSVQKVIYQAGIYVGIGYPGSPLPPYTLTIKTDFKQE